MKTCKNYHSYADRLPQCPICRNNRRIIDKDRELQGLPKLNRRSDPNIYQQVRTGPFIYKDDAAVIIFFCSGRSWRLV